VYQYEDENGVHDKRGWRPLNADEREALLGFRPGHTLAALKRDERPGGHYQRAGSDIRCSLLGNSFSCPAGRPARQCPSQSWDAPGSPGHGPDTWWTVAPRIGTATRL
jgi:hypothetical protein